MIYNGYFRQKKTDTLYTVRITTSDGTTSKEITLGGSPFVTEMDESNDTLYEPVKYQTATIEVVTADYMFDIYSSKAQDTKVELISNNEVQWVGYVRPNLFDMGFEKRRETIDIECSDALATLQYIPYRTDERKTRSFLYIINKLIKSCGAYKGFYVSDNIQLGEANGAILDKLYISEANFFDEKDENETYDDVAWKCNDVLEEICRYLGLTAISDKEYVWFLDYDAIKNGNNSYYFYAIDGGGGTRIELSYNKAIVAKDYSKNGAKLSLDNVYNKITIKADLNDFDSVIPSMYENLTNITSDTDPYVEAQTAHNRGEIIKSNIGETSNQNTIVLLDDTFIESQFVAAKYFNNANYKLFKYKNGADVTDTITSLNYSDTKSMFGATVAKLYSKSCGTNFWTSDTRDLDTVLSENDINSISLSNYVMLLNPSVGHISNDQITNYPYLQTTVTDNSAMFGGDNCYLLISGSYNYSSFSTWPLPYSGNIDLTEGRFAMDEDNMYLLCKLEWGGLCWNGSEWTGSDATFKLPYMKANTTKDDRRADATMFKDLDIRNTVSWRIGTSEKGYCIKAPTNTLVEGIPTLTVYKPFDPNYHSSKSGSDEGQYYKHTVVLLKDFDIKAVIGDPTYSDTSNTDTEYTAVINDEFTNDLSDITFKINTWDNKKPNYSSVAYFSNGGYHFLNKTYNKVLADDVNGMTYINENNVEATSDGSLRQEWWLVYKLYKQYSTPSIIMKMNLRNDIEINGTYSIHNIEGKIFIVDSVNRDYQNNSSEVKFIEKK